MSPHLIAATRRSLCSALEEIGNACTLLRTIEAGQSLPNSADGIIQLMDNAASELSTAGSLIFDTLNTKEPTKSEPTNPTKHP